LLQVLRTTRPDVVHVHDPHATGAGVCAVRMVGAGRPRLVASRRVPLPLRGTLSRLKFGACDRVLAVSRAVAEGLIRNGLSPDRVTLVHDGVPDRLLAVRGEDLARELRLPLGSRVIGNVAALTEHKDHDTLLMAMRRVLQVVPDALLLIAGEGPLRSRLESEARKRGLGERCVFTGFRSDVDRLMSCFSVFSLTSRIEGLGTTLLDAMCFSRPVVATATGGIPEAVRHGETGLLVPVGNAQALAAALVDLLTDEALRLAMGQAGRRLFEQRFTVARMVEGTLRVYDELCGSLARKPAAQGLGTATVPLQFPLGRFRYSSRNLRASSKASAGTIVPRTLG
jgi:glycosyltransferase involved in cell wall biosynthesis